MAELVFLDIYDVVCVDFVILLFDGMDDNNYR